MSSCRWLSRNLWFRRKGLVAAVSLWVLVFGAGVVFAADQPVANPPVSTGNGNEPISFRVVAVNPSSTKTQQVPVKIYLPQEVKPQDVIESGGLQLEYDDQRSSYYIYKDAVELAPKQTRVFEVLVKDVWRVPQVDLDALQNHAKLVLGRLEKSPYYENGKTIFAGIEGKIMGIVRTQNDDTLSRKQHIGAYRSSLQSLEAVKEDITRMEKLLSFTGGPPVPQMLQESPIKSDAPSTKTTWMLIFMILIFLGLLGGLFFWTWHRKAQEEKTLGVLKQGIFQGSSGLGEGNDKGKAA